MSEDHKKNTVDRHEESEPNDDKDSSTTQSGTATTRDNNAQSSSNAASASGSNLTPAQREQARQRAHNEMIRASEEHGDRAETNRKIKELEHYSRWGIPHMSEKCKCGNKTWPPT